MSIAERVYSIKLTPLGRVRQILRGQRSLDSARQLGGNHKAYEVNVVI